MAGIGNKGGGQRTQITSSSGRKERSPTSTSHTGSRVEPSHVHEKERAADRKANLKKITAKTKKEGKA